MAIELPQRGAPNWHIPLNEALQGLQGQQSSHLANQDAHGFRTWASLNFQPRVAGIDALLQQHPFYVGHRGQGSLYPEHTEVAYEAALSAAATAGLVPAIEVSVGTTADNVLVCLHDPTLDRTTDGMGALENYTWAQIRNTVKTDASGVLGAGWEGLRLSTLREVLDRFGGRCVIFLEAKTNPAFAPVREMITRDFPGSQDWIVWKKPYNSPTIPVMKGLGYRIWGYMDTVPADSALNAVDEHIDLWGVHIGASDADIERVTARGKPVMTWPVNRRSEVERLVGLGVQGIMCSSYTYVTRTPTQFSGRHFLAKTAFASQIRGPGDLGRFEQVDHTLVLGADGWAHFPAPTTRGAMFGSVSRDPAPANYTIKFSLMYPAAPADTTQWAGMAVCRPSDRSYGFGPTPTEDGYHIGMRFNGQMFINRHTAGSGSSTPLTNNSVGAAPVPLGDPMLCEIQVSPTAVTFRRTDLDPVVSITANNSAVRGGYINFTVGPITDAAASPRIGDIEVVS
jgi:glycerophosphoryl diester phosphodiesterase